MNEDDEDREGLDYQSDFNSKLSSLIHEQVEAFSIHDNVERHRCSRCKNLIPLLRQEEEEVNKMETVNFAGLEAVDTDSIPERSTPGRGHGKYFAILTNFVESGEQAALVHFEGDPKLTTVSTYMRKLISREGWDVQVLNRQGRLYLVRNNG